MPFVPSVSVASVQGQSSVLASQSTLPGSLPNPTTSQSAQFIGNSSKSRPIGPTLLLTILLCLTLLTQGTNTSNVVRRPQRNVAELRIRVVSDNVRAFAT